MQNTYFYSTVYGELEIERWRPLPLARRCTQPSRSPEHQASSLVLHDDTGPPTLPINLALPPSRCVALTDGAMRLFRLQCSDAMAPGACPPASPSVAFGFGRRGMQGATRRDSEADGDTGLRRHCRAYVEMEWCVPTAEKLSGIATPTCTSPPRPRAHARTKMSCLLPARCGRVQ